MSLPIRLKDQYDWIVIGDHPAALLSGALAAFGGYSVLMLPLEESRTVWTGKSGEYLDQESNFVLGLGEGQYQGPGLLLACLERLGLKGQEKSLIEREGSCLQLVTPELRFLLGPKSSDPSEELSLGIHRELGRELGAPGRDRLGIAQVLARAAPEQAKLLAGALDGFFLRTAYSTSHGAAMESTDLRKSEALRPGLNSRVPRAPRGAKKGRAAPGPGDGRLAFPSLATLSEELLKQPFDFPQALWPWFSMSTEVSAWAKSRNLGALELEAIEGAVAAMGSAPRSYSTADPGARMFEVLCLMAMVRTGASFRGGMKALRALLLRLALRNGAELPPQTSCQRIFIHQGKFVGVLPAGHGRMISAKGAALGCPTEKASALIELTPRTQKSSALGWKFTLALTVGSEGLPQGLSRRTVWHERDAPGLEIEVSSPAEYDEVQAGMEKRPPFKTLFLRSLMPMTAESLTTRFQRVMAARMLRKATEIAPFLELHISRIYPEFRTESCPELSTIYGRETLQDIPSHLLVYPRGCQSGIDSLFSASQEARAELGSLGAIWTAIESVEWLSRA